MSDRIGVVVGGALVGTVPVFPNGIGDMIKSPFYSAHKEQVWAEIRNGEIVLLRAETLDIAVRIPAFDASRTPGRSLRQALVSFFGFGKSSLM
jgi:hypothetical protein